MAYLVLARKWRPQSFEDLVGQDHVGRTLANAIAQDRVAHAFLFTGVRGVGKTTSARILAKALNCVQGPTAKPCLVCDPCREIALGTDMDVQEIDGASHTGVDDVRKIQESLPYRPARDRSKILIVDEVHMLSGNAWNAFLKTLEEPPAHVKFIFATTEVHKVPVTILSRCQRFDFKLIAAQVIAARVRHILGVEQIEADDAAVQLVAREAGGSMRDALSILDQAIAFGGKKLVGDEVAAVLGVADRAALHALASSIVEGRAADALKVIDELGKGGFDLAHVARDLLRRFRDLTIARTVENSDGLFDLADAELADVRGLAKATDADDLVRIFQGFSRALDEIARSATPRHVLEIAAVRLARRPALVPVDALIERLGQLERRLGGGGSSGGPGGGAARGGPGGSRPSGAGSSGRFESSPRSAPAEVSRALSDPPRASFAAHALATAVAPALTEPSADPIKRVSGPIEQPESMRKDDAIARARSVAAQLRAERGTWGSLLEHGVILRADAEGFVIAYERRSFLAAQVAERAVTSAIVRAAMTALGAPTEIVLSELAPIGRSLAQFGAAVKSAALDAARGEAVRSPVVQDALTILGAELRHVKLPGDE